MLPLVCLFVFRFRHRVAFLSCAIHRTRRVENESVVPVSVVVQAVGIFYLRAHPLACAPRSLLLKFSAQFEMPSIFFFLTTTNKTR